MMVYVLILYPATRVYYRATFIHYLYKYSGQNVSDSNFHFYADDTVIYCCVPTLVQAIESLQKLLTVVQNTLLQLKLVLDADKTKLA